jgi:hypothetical protein
MARIPLGNFGQGAGTAPLQQTRIANPVGAAGDAVGRLADIAGNIAQRELVKDVDENEALARAKASNARTAHDLQVRAKADDITGRVQRGEIAYDQAEKVYDEEVGAIETPDLKLPPAVAEAYHGAISNNRLAGRLTIQNAAQAARRDDGKAQFAAALDLGAKEAAAPGADVDKINARMEQWRPLARSFGLSDEAITKSVQTFKDNNWVNVGTQRLLAARDDAAGLQQLEQDLTAENGFFAARLDPDKRNVLLRQVLERKDALARQVDTAANKAESRAERAVNFLADANSTGIPVLPEKILELQGTVAGTTHAQDFADQLAIGQEIAKVRTLPFAAQQQYIDQRQAELSNGSENPKRDATRMATLRGALEASRKQAQESPLIFFQNQGGHAIEPIDFRQLATKEGADAVSEQLADRYDVLAAMRKQYGPDVAMNPWRPEEAEGLKSAMQQANSDGAKLLILSSLARNAPDAKAYRETLQPIAQTDPAAYLAGQEQYLGHRAGKNGPLGPIILQGSRVIADKSFAMPPDEKFRQAFEEEAGSAYEPGTPQRDEAYNRFRFLYAGLANKIPPGRSDAKELDEELRATALNLATGGMTEYQGRQTIKPFAWTDHEFADSVRVQLDTAAKATGYPRESLEDLPLQQLPGREGEYFILSGARFLPDPKTGAPLILRLSKVQAPKLDWDNPIYHVHDRARSQL